MAHFGPLDHSVTFQDMLKVQQSISFNSTLNHSIFTNGGYRLFSGYQLVFPLLNHGNYTTRVNAQKNYTIWDIKFMEIIKYTNGYLLKICIYLLFLCLNDLDLLGEFGFWSGGKKRLFNASKKYSPCVQYHN